MNQEFCRECNNMLYPKEDKAEKILYMACRNCEHFEEAKTNRIYFSEFSHKHGENTLLKMSKEMAHDPTLPRSKKDKCPNCQAFDAVYVQPRDSRQEAALIVYFICCKCYHVWSSLDEES